jgi:hypothetical protein
MRHPRVPALAFIRLSAVVSTAVPALIAALALALPTGARAEASADGRVTGLTLSLVDLDPGDGLPATASWLDGGALISASLSGGSDPDLAFSLSADARGGPLGQALASTGLQAAAQVSGDGLAASGWSAGGSFYVQALSAHGLQLGGLQLGPMTGLRLTLDYRLLASVDALAPGCNPCDNAQLTLSASLGLGTAQPVFDSASVVAFADLGPLRDERSGALQLAWDNRGSAAQTVDMTVALIAQGSATAVPSAPVPEPASALLWLACAAAAALRHTHRRAGSGRTPRPGAGQP